MCTITRASTGLYTFKKQFFAVAFKSWRAATIDASYNRLYREPVWFCPKRLCGSYILRFCVK